MIAWSCRRPWCQETRIRRRAYAKTDAAGHPLAETKPPSGQELWSDLRLHRTGKASRTESRTPLDAADADVRLLVALEDDEDCPGPLRASSELGTTVKRRSTTEHGKKDRTSQHLVAPC